MAPDDRHEPGMVTAPRPHRGTGGNRVRGAGRWPAARGRRRLPGGAQARSAALRCRAHARRRSIPPRMLRDALRLLERAVELRPQVAPPGTTWTSCRRQDAGRQSSVADVLPRLAPLVMPVEKLASLARCGIGRAPRHPAIAVGAGRGVCGVDPRGVPRNAGSPVERSRASDYDRTRVDLSDGSHPAGGVQVCFGTQFSPRRVARSGAAGAEPTRRYAVTSQGRYSIGCASVGRGQPSSGTALLRRGPGAATAVVEPRSSSRKRAANERGAVTPAPADRRS